MADGKPISKDGTGVRNFLSESFESVGSDVTDQLHAQEMLQINTIQSTTDFTVKTDGLKAKIKKINPTFRCHICGRTMTRQTSLKYHINTHTGNKPYVCHEDGCGAGFASPNQRSKHKRQVHKKKKNQMNTSASSLDVQLDTMANEVANLLSCIDEELQRNQTQKGGIPTVAALDKDTPFHLTYNDEIIDESHHLQTSKPEYPPKEPATAIETPPVLAKAKNVIKISSDEDDEAVRAMNIENASVFKLPKLDDSFYDSDDQLDTATPKYVIEIDDTLFNSDNEPDEQSVFGQMLKREQDWEAEDFVADVTKNKTNEIEELPASPLNVAHQQQQRDCEMTDQVPQLAEILEPPASPPIALQTDFSQIDIRKLSECISNVMQQTSKPSSLSLSDVPEAPDLSTQPPVSTFPKVGTFDFVIYYNANNWMFTNNSIEMAFYSKLVHSMNPPNPGYYTFDTPLPNTTLPPVTSRPLVAIKIPETPAIRCSDERHACRHYARGHYARLLNKIALTHKKKRRRGGTAVKT